MTSQAAGSGWRRIVRLLWSRQRRQQGPQRLHDTSIDPDQIVAVALQYTSPTDRNTLYIRLWLIWMAILVIGFAYVLFSDRAF
jgi:hypothetical protein